MSRLRLCQVFEKRIGKRKTTHPSGDHLGVFKVHEEPERGPDEEEAMRVEDEAVTRLVDDLVWKISQRRHESRLLGRPVVSDAAGYEAELKINLTWLRM